MRRPYLFYALTLLVTGTLTGCGGGGGGSSQPLASIQVLGRVVGPDGNAVPGATVSGGGGTTTSLSQGDFQLTNIGTGVDKFQANINSNGKTYLGTTQALVVNQQTTSNVVIAVSPTDQQASITGTVTDNNGNPIRDARVFVGQFATPPAPAGTGDVESVVAFTDDQGRYRFDNVYANGSTYTMGASLLNYQNAIVTVPNLANGETRHIDLGLNNSSNQSVSTPQNFSVQSFTEPRLVTPSVQSKTSAEGSYLAIRKLLSPAYAAHLANGHLAAHVVSLSKTIRAQYYGLDVVEIDAFFDESSVDSLAGFRIYSATGNNQLQPYDFLQDPLANFYTDSSSDYQTNQKYNFAVSAVNTDNSESGLSNAAYVDPLDIVTGTTPVNGQTISNPVTLSWNGVNGASGYAIFLYNQFPGAQVQPIVSNQSIPGTSTSYNVANALPSGNYWYVVAATADGGSAISVSQIVEFHVN